MILHLCGARDQSRICTPSPARAPIPKSEKLRIWNDSLGAKISLGLFLPKHMHLCQFLPSNGLDAFSTCKLSQTVVSIGECWFIPRANDTGNPSWGSPLTCSVGKPCTLDVARAFSSSLKSWRAQHTLTYPGNHTDSSK